MTKITAVVSAALLCTATLNAQSTFGTIAGLVRDSAKAPIADAMITVTKKDGGSIRTTISNSGGLYSFADVVPGEYSAVAQSPGLPDITLASLKVTAGQATRADLNSNAVPSVTAPATTSTISSPEPVNRPPSRNLPLASLGLPQRAPSLRGPIWPNSICRLCLSAAPAPQDPSKPAAAMAPSGARGAGSAARSITIRRSPSPTSPG